MKHWQKLLAVVLFTSMLVGPAKLFGQATLLYASDGGTITLDCSQNYVISEADTAPTVEYATNIMDSITICPDGINGGTVSLSFSGTFINPSYGFNAEWDLDPTDSIYIYDGENTNAPLIGAYTSNSHPNVNVQSSFDNPTGCLTLVFVTDGSDGGVGFNAVAGCGYPCQPFSPTISSNPVMEPSDTGYVDICLGDEVELDAGALFPYSSANGGLGYNQTVSNSQFDWTISDGTSFEDQQSITFTPDQRAGYSVELTVTDTLGCPQTIRAKIRVSTVPIFSEMASALNDEVCINNPGILLGGVSQNDTSSVGVAATETSFIAGGIFAGLTYLPDGNGNSYETDIEITQFGTGQTVQNPSDIVEVCLNIEHSYLGDLDIQLTCPSGTTVDLVQAILLGPGSGTFLGEAFDDNIGTPGTGWTYCWNANPTYGTMEAEAGSGNTVTTPLGDALPEGSYTPIEPLSNFIGCPINGTWTITVTDNQGIDDGYIFYWGINFDPAINPSIETYAPTLLNGWWENDPTIVAELGDTAIQVVQESPGTYGYQFYVEDDFGCVYDTTVNIVVIPANELNGVTQSCIDDQVLLEVTNSKLGGEWSAEPATISFLPDPTNENPEVQASEEGVYTFYFYDTFCDASDSIVITIANTPDVNLWADTNRVCNELKLTANASAGTSIFEGGNDLTWMPSGAVGSLFEVDAANPDHYNLDPVDTTMANISVTASNYCGSSSADFDFEILECEVKVPGVFSPSAQFPENRYFNIVALELHEGNNVKIFDRWGRKCYDVTDYHLNPWDGGKESDGVYYYVVERPEYEPEVGYVHLFRGSGQ